MAKIIRVNLTKKRFFLNRSDKYLCWADGVLTSQIIFDEVDPNCGALGKNNKLVIAPGLLTGTPAPAPPGCRLAPKALLPRNQESNAGGTVARKLANLGIKAIILEGKPEFPTWHLLKITNAAVVILPAGDIVGLGTTKRWPGYRPFTVRRLHHVYRSGG